MSAPWELAVEALVDAEWGLTLASADLLRFGHGLESDLAAEGRDRARVALATLRRAARNDECRVSLVSSRMCECGTKGCEVQHAPCSAGSVRHASMAHDPGAHKRWRDGLPGMYVLAYHIRRVVAGPYETIEEAISEQAALNADVEVESEDDESGRINYVIARRGRTDPADEENNEVEAVDRLAMALTYFRRALYSDDEIRAELERLLPTVDEW